MGRVYETYFHRAIWRLFVEDRYQIPKQHITLRFRPGTPPQPRDFMPMCPVTAAVNMSSFNSPLPQLKHSVSPGFRSGAILTIKEKGTLHIFEHIFSFSLWMELIRKMPSSQHASDGRFQKISY
jgi:hypothetical protein